VKSSSNGVLRLGVPPDKDSTKLKDLQVSRKRKRNEKKQQRKGEEEGKSSLLFCNASRKNSQTQNIIKLST